MVTMICCSLTQRLISILPTSQTVLISNECCPSKVWKRKRKGKKRGDGSGFVQPALMICLGRTACSCTPLETRCRTAYQQARLAITPPEHLRQSSYRNCKRTVLSITAQEELNADF